MCQRVTCNKCGMPGYAGCGRHIEAVLGDVAPESRCRCREERAKQAPLPSKRGAWLSSWLSRAGGRRS